MNILRDLINASAFLGASLLLTACADNGAGDSAVLLDDSVIGAQKPMAQFRDDTQLLDSLRQAARMESSQLQSWAYAEVAESAAATDTATSATTSATNVQVSGVDEADWIKRDGNLLFALSPSSSNASAAVTTAVHEQSNAQLQAFELSMPAKLLDQVTLFSETQWSGLYQTPQDKTLWLLGQNWNRPVAPNHSSYWWNGGAVSLQARSFDDSANKMSGPRWQFEFDGRLVGSRQIENTLYLVTEYGAPYVHPAGENTGNIDQLTLKDWLPRWSLDGENQGALVASNECYAAEVDERQRSTQITTVIALSLDRPGELQARCLLGATETVFVSPSALYLATTDTYYSGWFFADAIFPTSMRTDVHKFTFDDGLSYRGGVRLAGHLGWHAQRRSYRMGEHEGVLSVVTSSAPVWNAQLPDHRLFTLIDDEQGLKLQAQLPNAKRPNAIGGPGEQIYGTRLVGDKMYVVTFLTTDPLYVIDVSNAADPYIAGELKVPGFSDYLHPVPGDRLLGIGKSASMFEDGDEGRGGWYQGLRLSLFDVADPSRPKLINALEYGDRGSSSDVLHDVHALAWLNTANGGSEFALPFNLYLHSKPPTAEWQQGQFVHRGLYRFVIDEAGLAESSVALLPSTSDPYAHEGRSLLADDGSAWFFDQAKLYSFDAAQPSVALPSQ